MFWWILLFISLILLYIKISKKHKLWLERNVPQDKTTFFFGNMYRVLLRKISFAEGIEEIYNRNKSYKYFGVYNVLQPILMLRDPEIIKQIGIKEFDSFLDHQAFVSEDMDPLFGKNVFSLKGQKWRKMRSTLSPAFTSSKMKSMFVLMSDCAERFVNYFINTAEPEKPIVLEMKDTFTRFSTDIVATCVFGLECNSLQDRNNEFYLRGKDTTDFSGLRRFVFLGYNLSPFLMKLMKVRLLNEDLSNFFRNLVMGTIKMREEKGLIRPDMLQLLMEARKGNLKYEESAKKEKEAGFATVEELNVEKIEDYKYKELTDDDLTAQAMGFFFAGFDTISTLLCHMANELAVNPDIQQKLQKEIDDTLSNCKDGKITYEALTKMKYMDMVVSETLRKWPPNAFTDRVCTKTFVLKSGEDTTGGLTLNKGDLLWIPIYALHRDPEYFPNPERFDPERFSDENKNNIIPCTYLPFGLGPRSCIGSRFVLLEVKTLFVYLLSNFDIIVDKKTQVPLKLSRIHANMMAEKGFWLGLKSRNK